MIAFVALLYASLPILLLSRRVAVFLMLAALVGNFLTYLTAGIIGYRRTMRRPWPKVPPIEDDDDDW